MHQDITRIYHNDIGITFQWKKKVRHNVVQMVFRDMGFHLTVHELKTFAKYVKETKHSMCTQSCPNKENCRSILLETPSPMVSLAVSVSEIEQIEDLIKGTLFQLTIEE